MPNRLDGESSAYLLQHRHNPVDWHPWGDEAWSLARELDRPVLVSIGYSSCHWCHVMERESFEDPRIAQLMNEQLVSIKVDREERPDVDQIYMDAVLRLIGHGGWPLNVFCRPDGRPFYGGTYFPPVRAANRPSFPDVVAAVARLYRERPDDVESQARQLMDALRARPDARGAAPDLAALPRAFSRELMQRADTAQGGFGAAPKFPTPVNLEALLLASRIGQSGAGVLEHVVLTCKRMAKGGIFDQLGGGFHRYSTDARWLVPHFEKMLYDQGQLLRAFAETYRQAPEPDLAWPVAETVDYLEREMRDPAGGLYASQDADSEGEEGRFYVFDPDEVRALLGDERAGAFCTAYSVQPGGTFEHTGKSVLEHKLAGERARFAAERAILLEARGKRVPPDTDRKQVTAWTAYAVGGLATAAASFARSDWREAAERAADFVIERMIQGDPLGGDWELLRIFDGERARVPAFLDDHAALLCALLDLARAGARPVYVDHALVLGERICERFYDSERAELFMAGSGDATLVVRPSSDMDGATPASAGMAALGLARLGVLCGRNEFRDVVSRVLEAHAPLLGRAPSAFPSLIRAAEVLDSGGGLALVLGPGSDPSARALAERARSLLGPEDAVVVAPPDALPAWLDPEWSKGRSQRDGRPTAFLCRGRVCSLPATHPDELELPPRV